MGHSSFAAQVIGRGPTQMPGEATPTGLTGVRSREVVVQVVIVWTDMAEGERHMIDR